MFKKLVILALILVGAYYFYKYLIAPTLEPFLKQKVEFGLKEPEVRY